MDSPEHSNEKKALYQIAIDDILQKIKDNEFSFEKPICTEKLLMEQYGISRITAKRAITELESKGILYRKRGVGSFVSRSIYSKTNIPEKTNHLFAFVLPFNITKGGLNGTFQTANSILNNAGYGMSIYITDSNAASRGYAVLSRVLNEDISGIVYYPRTNNIHLDLLNRFVLGNKPVIIMDVNTDCPYLHSVTSDNYNGQKTLTEYLISLGHKKIGYLSGFAPEERTTIRDRFGGYLTAIRQNGFQLDPNLIITNMGISYRVPEENGSPLSAPIYKAISQMVKSGATAIVAENDELAFYTAMACDELGIKVPEQLSICGFDNSEFSHITSSGITTVSQDFVGIGKNIADILLESLNQNSMEAKKIILPTELVIQGSTAPPRPE
jgi:Transcriptional regulators